MVIRTRDNLIEFIENNAPYPRIKRALIEGTNENFGGFRTPYSNGWIVKITGKRKEWILAIKLRVLNKYEIYISDKVPWKYWQGDKSENPLYQGDNIKKYKKLREEANHAETRDERSNNT